jgi:hypothetical protein
MFATHSHFYILFSSLLPMCWFVHHISLGSFIEFALYPPQSFSRIFSPLPRMFNLPQSSFPRIFQNQPSPSNCIHPSYPLRGPTKALSLISSLFCFQLLSFFCPACTPPRFLYSLLKKQLANHASSLFSDTFHPRCYVWPTLDSYSCQYCSHAFCLVVDFMIMLLSFLLNTSHSRQCNSSHSNRCQVGKLRLSNWKEVSERFQRFPLLVSNSQKSAKVYHLKDG